MPTGSHMRALGTVFDRVAEAYDRHRPAYPDEVIDQACELAGLAAGDRVLEVGCGSGQATRSLLARGLSVTALEPGDRLRALAERNLGECGQVDFVNGRFEDAKLPGGPFSAVFSASAFHWIDPHVSWSRAAQVLPAGGTLALIQYFGLEDERTASDHAALLSALARIAPEAMSTWPVYRDLQATIAGVERRRHNISEAWSWLGRHDLATECAGSLFEDVQLVAMPVMFEHTAEELGAVVRTLSFHSRLSPEQRQAIERAHVEICEQLGRPIRSSAVAVCVTARRSAALAGPCSPPME